MRQRVIEAPYAPSATWTRRLALFGAMIAAVTIVMAHRTFVSPLSAVILIACAITLALLAIVSGVVAAVVIWRTGHRGVGRILAGVLLACATLAYPAKAVGQG